MKFYEFALLILGMLSLIHYISYSVYRYKNFDKFVIGIYKEKSSIVVIRFIEVSIIITNNIIWLYKFLF